KLIRPRRREVAINQVARPISVRARLRGRRPRAAAHSASQAHFAHQAANPTPGGPEILAAHLLPDLARPVHLVVLVPDALNDRPEDRVLLGTRRTPHRIPFFHFAFEVRRRGDRQHAADRLDPVGAFVLVDEGDHHFARRSSSAWAKNADALRKISFARLSSTFSRWSRFSSARSSVVRPGRFPASRSAWRTHRRRDSSRQPNFSATDRIVAHCEGYSWACSNTMRTARSRSSGEYLVPRGIGSILSRKEPSEKPGTIHHGVCAAMSVRFVREEGRVDSTKHHPCPS